MGVHVAPETQNKGNYLVFPFQAFSDPHHVPSRLCVDLLRRVCGLRVARTRRQMRRRRRLQGGQPEAQVRKVRKMRLGINDGMMILLYIQFCNVPPGFNARFIPAGWLNEPWIISSNRQSVRRRRERKARSARGLDYFRRLL